jgi:DNA-binding response OmpR family regulator
MEGKRVLIVEDEPRIALALCRALEHRFGQDCEVEISPVAETALVKLQNRTVDLLVTDLRMPGMGGLAFIRQVREISPQTQTMLITAFGSSEIEAVTHKLGTTYLPKPFSLQEFIVAVETILSEEGSG